MTSEDWKTVLLALITTGGGVFATFAAIYLEWLRRKATAAEVAASAAQKTASDTKLLINGRMDDLLEQAKAKAYAEGLAAGVAKVSDAVARSPKISLDAQGVAGAIAAASKPTAPASPAPAG